MIDSYRVLSELVDNRENVSFNGKFLKLESAQDIITLIDGLKLNPQIEGNVITIDLSQVLDNTYCFFDESDFVKRYENINQFDSSIICILKSHSGFLIKETSASFSDDLRFVFNFHFYSELLHFFINSTDFISYSIETQQEFILMDKNGPIEIGYNPLEKRVDQLENLAPGYQRLKEMFEKFEFQEFFKAAVVLSITNYSKRDRFFRMVESLSIFIDQAEKDYKLYLSQFAFEKIKSKFKKERTKYFESIEKNIESINKQVTTFPLTFSASIFASYQVKEKPIILLLILSAYLLYTIVAWLILNISLNNLEGIKKDLDSESSQIKNTSLALYESIEPDLGKINKKLNKLFRLVYFLRFVLIFLIVLFLGFISYQYFTTQIDISVGRIFANS